MFRVCILGSGSEGNCTVVATSRACVLIDVGFGKRNLKARLQQAGLSHQRVDAVLLTHGHTDHIRGVLAFVSEQDVPVYMNEGTRNEVPELQSISRWETFATDSPFAIGDLHIEPFAISHDAADPVGFRFLTQGSCGALATDLGEVGDSVVNSLNGCDWLILESNHDEDMVKIGPYPWLLKQRLLGHTGHLSNKELARFLSHHFDGQATDIFLAHLSQRNNHPRIALQAASRALACRTRRKPWKLHLTHQSKPSIVLEL